MDSEVCFANTYLLDSDLSGGWHHPPFEQLGPGEMYNNNNSNTNSNSIIITFKIYTIISTAHHVLACPKLYPTLPAKDHSCLVAPVDKGTVLFNLKENPWEEGGKEREKGKDEGGEGGRKRERVRAGSREGRRKRQ